MGCGANLGPIGLIRSKVACALPVIGTQEMFCLEHRKCLVWNTENALLGAHECFACDKGNLVFAIEETYDDSS